MKKITEKTFINKLLCVILIVVLCLSFIGCKKETEDTLIPSTPSHEGEATIGLTDNLLVSNGSTDYKIIYPENSDSYIDEAVAELKLFFIGATGANIIAVSDKDENWTKDSKYISLGQTTALQESGLEIGGNRLPKGDAYQIQNKGKSVFIVGGSTSGTLYGVYAFLKFQFDFEVFASDEIYFASTTECALLDYQVKEVPDFEVRVVGYGDLWDTGGLEAVKKQAAHRMNANYTSEIWVTIDSRAFHNTYAFVPPNEYKQSHPDWFSTCNNQLCFTRDVPGLSAVVIERMKQEIVNQPKGKLISISQEDGSTWCSCASCSAAKEKYGSDSASNLLFNNVCAKEINRWLKAESGDPLGSYTDDYKTQYGVYGGQDRTIMIGMFAYVKTQNPPAKLNDKGEYVSTIDVELEDNLAAYIALIGAEFNYPLTDKKNLSNAITMSGWQSVVNNIWAWHYSLYETSCYVPFNCINTMQANYKYSMSKNATYIFEEGNKPTKGTDWNSLKNYLAAQLMWNTDQNVQALIDKFMKQYFGDASQIMSDLLTDQREWMGYAENVLGRPGYVSQTSQATEARYWPKNLLLDYLGRLQSAEDAISHLKDTDSIRYEVLSERILREGFAYRYLLLKNYKADYSRNKFEQMKSELLADVTRLGYSEQARYITVLEVL